jgi:peroxiredoxin
MILLSLLFGIWRGVFALPDQELPFLFELEKNSAGIVFTIHNADERIACTEVTINGDSLFVRLPMYDSEFRLQVKDSVMQGVWINHLRKGSHAMDFVAKHDVHQRFSSSEQPAVNITGKWETWFNSGLKDSSVAIGQFNQKDNIINGTFLTESGDHRYLEGVLTGDSMKLSVFDGFFCRLYLAKVKGDTLEGMFYSGTTHKAPFKAVRNEKIKLRDAATLSHFEGKPAFTFPDTDSIPTSLQDEKYRNKVVILQIMGTWCPNCMDESAFLSEYYNSNRNKGVEIIGISFERTADFSKASEYLKRVKNRFNINYPLLYAGTTGTGVVEKALPGMKNFFSYPSTIFIGKDGEVKHVHAGFNGPATGEEYEAYKREFYDRMQKLLAE